MADQKQERAEVGFIGSQVIALTLTDRELGAFRKKLGGSGWLTVATEDGEVDIDLGKVAFVRVAADEHSVGFGG